MSPLRWTLKSTRVLAAELTRAGHKVGANLVGDLLHYLGYSLQANAKVTENRQHLDRSPGVGLAVTSRGVDATRLAFSY